MNKKAWGLKPSKTIMNREEKEHPTTLTCYPLGHDVSHLTAGGEHPHAQLVHHQHLEAKGTVHTWKHREQFTAWGAPAVTLASPDCIRLQEEPRNTEF